MDQTWCPVCPVAVKGELLRCNEATVEQGLSLTIQDWEELQAAAGRRWRTRAGWSSAWGS